MYCQDSVTGRLLYQRTSVECDVSINGRETSAMRRPRQQEKISRRLYVAAFCTINGLMLIIIWLSLSQENLTTFI